MTTPHSCLPDAIRYATELGWWLVPTRGPASPKPKAPIHRGWPDFRPSADDVRWVFDRYTTAGVGLNLGGSGLIDVEADAAEGDEFLEGFCAGVPHPCWRSRRGRHHLFRDPGGAPFAELPELGVEFRAGRHMSVLPPTPMPEGDRYEWLVDPFAVPPPPLPDALAEVYRAAQKARSEPPRGNRPVPPDARRFPFRDDFDYLLRHFDLRERAAEAGLEFAAARPDASGNIACFVPAALRGGNPDDHPSGVFNVFNGRLRDFATGAHHRYFDLIAALTGSTWELVWKDYEAGAGGAAVRSHSRRLGPPTPTGGGDRVSLDEARSRLRDYVDAQLARAPAPKTLHLILGPCGLGKTWQVCAALAARRRPAVVLTLENKLAGVHAALINGADGGRARRMPVLRESPCPHPDAYERSARLGYQPSRGEPCRSCAIGPRRCPYLLAFSSVETADQLCAAAVYHTHDGFYAAHGNDRRSVVVFDENCLDLLLAPVAHPLSAWRAWGGLYREAVGPQIDRPGFRPVLDLLAWLDAAAEEFGQSGKKFAHVAVPERLRAEVRASPIVQYRLTRVAGRGWVPNLYAAAVYLLTEPDAHVLFERGGGTSGIWVRFRRRHPLPEDREVFVLDATASEELIRAAAPGWDVRVWECPPVEQRGRVVQVVDYDVSRNFVRKEVARHTTHSPCWLAQVADAVLDRHGAAALVGFKSVAEKPAPEIDLLGKLRHPERLAPRHHFPARGYTIPAETLVVLGTPYKDEAAVWELALAAFGAAGLPTGEYRRRPRLSGDFLVRTMSHGEDRLRAVEDFLVSAELAQAVGRVRPLQNPATVYVLSNAPVPGWEVEQATASELFDLRRPLRRDAREGFERYAAEVTRRLDTQDWVGNREVCAAIGMKDRTGREMMARFRKRYGPRLAAKGHKICWVAKLDEPPRPTPEDDTGASLAV
jgi:hypothetical protein